LGKANNNGLMVSFSKYANEVRTQCFDILNPAITAKK
jgi:hypothetical protein